MVRHMGVTAICLESYVLDSGKFRGVSNGSRPYNVVAMRWDMPQKHMSAS